MKPYQRVANKHMARTSPKHNLTFNTSWEFSSKLISVATEGGLEQARIEAWIEDDLDDLEDYECFDEIQDLIQLSGSDDLFIVEVSKSWLHNFYWGKGLGYQMYLNLIQYIYKDFRKPFLFIPNYCSDSITSKSALRVWRSFARKYPSSGDVILIDKYPTK